MVVLGCCVCGILVWVFRWGLRLWCEFVGLCLGRWLFVVEVLVVVVCFCFRGGFVLIVLFLFTF